MGVLGSGRASNEENFLAVTLARSALETPNVDEGLGAGYRALLAGSKYVGRPGSIEALEHADLVVVLEGDVAVSHPRLALGIMRALRRGGRLITLGWRRTQASELAGLHIPLSGSRPLDTLLDLRAGLLARLSGGEGMGRAPDDLAGPATRAVDWLVASRRVVFLLSPFDADGTVLEACASTVSDMARVLEAGEGTTAWVWPLPLRANTCGALDMGVVPDRLPGRRLLDDRDARERLRSLWRGQACWDPGLSAEAMPFSVAGLVVLADDVTAFHDMPGAAREALSGLDSLIVLDSFLTPTARAANVVLPIAAFGEYDGTVTSLEGRVQAWRAWQPPPEAVRPGWQVLRDLLGALGAGWLPGSLGEIQEVMRQVVPSEESADAIEASRASGSVTPEWPGGDATVPEPRAAADEDVSSSSSGRMTLRRDGAFDWGEDPLASSSPILRRDHGAARKRHPDGVVLMNPEEAGALGVREGWRVRLASGTGHVEVPVSLRPGVEKGVLLVPYMFRDLLAAVSDRGGTVEVQVTRV